MSVTASLPYILRSAFFKCMRQPFSSSPNVAVDYFETDYKARLSTHRYELLLDSLERTAANPSRAWENYMNVLDSLGIEHLPLEIHQKVLRKCVPSTQQLRHAAQRRMEAKNFPQIPHMYEYRLRTVIRNMRAAGLNPTVEDYNFILGQFAVVGYHTGTMYVLQEMNHIAVEPNAKTYGLCLQSIAHRLTLPCLESLRAALVEECSELCVSVLKNMSAKGVPFTSVNLDLALRIWKDTDNKEAFERILKFGYGVDLDYPDQFPLEVNRDKASAGENLQKIYSFQPFSTHTLNTTIDYLGRTGKISKMVQAFEVLTNPLPKVSPDKEELSVDDEEDDIVYPPPAPPLDQLPHAAFNITTFNMLIRHLGKARHTVLARHYVLQAIRHDIAISDQLRQDLESKPFAEILSPRVAVNRGTLLPLLGLGNRDGDLNILRWILDQTRVVKKYKKHNLAFLEQISTGLDNQIARDHISSRSVSNKNALLSGTNDIVNESATIDMSLRVALQPVLNNKKAKSDVHPLDVDFDSTPVPRNSEKRLDLSLHVAILRRDLQEVKEFEQRVKDAFARLHERVKEKLGRRVWRGQDIYLADRRTRTIVSKEKWKEIVNFQNTGHTRQGKGVLARGRTSGSTRSR